MKGGTIASDQAATKAALRLRMREARGAIPPDERARLGTLVERRLLALPEVGGAARVLLFYSFGSEVPTSGVARKLHDDGKRLFLPYLAGDEIEAAEVGPSDPLVPTGYGPREPERRAPVDVSEIDVVVTPGLAFDRRGHRLGYGGGHYDRFLPRVERAVRIGICFSSQLVDDVPVGSNDQPVDLVVTDSETLDCRGGRS